MSSWTEDPPDRALIEQLMRHGWYRLGQGPRDESGRITWGFREGHLLETPHANTRWIGAADERGAMRALLATLRGDTRASSRRRAPSRHDGEPHDLWSEFDSVNSRRHRQRFRQTRHGLPREFAEDAQ